MANRSMFYRTDVSCGVQQLSNLDYDSETILKSAFSSYHYPPGLAAHIVFSDAFNREYRRKRTCNGTILAKFIVDNKLGTVVRSPGKKNPNSGNRIAVWIWTPNERSLQVWLKRRTRNG